MRTFKHGGDVRIFRFSNRNFQQNDKFRSWLFYTIRRDGTVHTSPKSVGMWTTKLRQMCHKKSQISGKSPRTGLTCAQVIATWTARCGIHVLNYKQREKIGERKKQKNLVFTASVRTVQNLPSPITSQQVQSSPVDFENFDNNKNQHFLLPDWISMRSGSHFWRMKKRREKMTSHVMHSQTKNKCAAHWNSMPVACLVSLTSPNVFLDHKRNFNVKAK